MSEEPDAVPKGLADLPLDVRNAREAQTRREIEEGMARRHAVVTAQDRAIAAARFASVLQAGRNGPNAG